MRKWGSRSKVRTIRSFSDYGISKERLTELLNIASKLSYQELLDVAMKVDKFNAELLVLSIRENLSYDALEERFGYIIINKNVFYERRRKVFALLDAENK